jgi:hypothetical protein
MRCAWVGGVLEILMEVLFNYSQGGDENRWYGIPVA